MRAVPVLAETSTIAAGMAGMPLRKFVPVIAVANLGIAGAYAYIGAFSLAMNSILLTFATAVILPLAAVGIHFVCVYMRGRSSTTETPIMEIVLSSSDVYIEKFSIDQSEIFQKFSIDFEYSVTFTKGVFETTNEALVLALSACEPEKYHRCLVFVDAGVIDALPDIPRAILSYGEAHAARMEVVDVPVTVPGGERIKTELTHIEDIRDRIHTARIDRHSYVIAVGGGAVLDAVGLAAATAHRGVRLVRVPTTVLAQNDSGVGVKNAVNLKGIKNYVGTFSPPWAVLNDYDFIRVLPRRERIAGVSEAVKVALIRDGAFFRWLEDNAERLVAFEPAAEQYMIRRCAELHMVQIAHGGDPFETGSARPLDYGHWSAHKVEALTSHAVKHGEAVAIGVALDTRYSVLAGLLAAGEEMRVITLLRRLGLPIFHEALERVQDDGQLEVIRGLEDFREHLGGRLTVTLLSGLGTGREVNEIDAAVMAEAIAWLHAQSKV